MSEYFIKVVRISLENIHNFHGGVGSDRVSEFLLQGDHIMNIYIWLN